MIAWRYPGQVIVPSNAGSPCGLTPTIRSLAHARRPWIWSSDAITGQPTCKRHVGSTLRKLSSGRGRQATWVARANDDELPSTIAWRYHGQVIAPSNAGNLCGLMLTIGSRAHARHPWIWSSGAIVGQPIGKRRVGYTLYKLSSGHDGEATWVARAMMSFGFERFSATTARRLYLAMPAVLCGLCSPLCCSHTQGAIWLPSSITVTCCVEAKPRCYFLPGRQGKRYITV